jgi:hypothetical protein
LLGHISGIGIHDLTQEEFGSNRNDFSFHLFPFFWTQIYAENTDYGFMISPKRRLKFQASRFVILAKAGIQ